MQSPYLKSSYNMTTENKSKKKLNNNADMIADFSKGAPYNQFKKNNKIIISNQTRPPTDFKKRP